MALGMKLSGGLRMKGAGAGDGGAAGGGVVIEEEKLGLAFASTRYPKRLGKKRIVISNDLKETLPHLDSSDSSESADAERSPLKRQCSRREMDFVGSDVSVLESLPQDILIKVICGVNHDDLKQLIRVSKTIREATSIAKIWHFAYNTPLKTRVFPKSIDFAAKSSEFDEREAPNAPLRTNSFRSRLSSKKLSDIAIALFSSPDEDDRPKKGLHFDTEI